MAAVWPLVSKEELAQGRVVCSRDLDYRFCSVASIKIVGQAVFAPNQTIHCAGSDL